MCGGRIGFLILGKNVQSAVFEIGHGNVHFFLVFQGSF